MIDRDEIDEALEIACGFTIGSGQSVTSRRTASQRHVNTARRAVIRFLRELPAELTVHEIKEALSDEAQALD